MPLPTPTKEITGPGWQPCLTAVRTYCQVGQHFIEARQPAYRFWVTPSRSIATVCVPCSGEEEE